MSSSLDNRSYYDDFAAWYERERGRGYHQMLDDLEVELVERFGRGKRVLEVGCGTGLLLERFADFADSALGIDLSGGMLAKARARGLAVAQASATALPFPDAHFDVVCSFKVLPHVSEIRLALAEMARVTRPGGHVLAEFYNPRSLRYLVKKLKTPTAVSEQTTDEAVYTRYDTPERVLSYLPSSLAPVTVRGIRIVTPVAAVHRVPGVGRLLRGIEGGLADLPGVRSLGGFVVTVAQKR
ncbi:class I SAM-dependent methyltransferase [Haliangium ochraceum]|uniref:Methyltransferase type 11 n=1 Tax=Haliangium ochraceum (strain DSM 14365 / JCM 11303 / SMP-2) TaxID=502025 RepID=D0LKT0_HALO1|nr:class I SAM-dependent methyltransferase [Haliangium ochraceum]ACY16650.1 Methyltransferase type 11 [Haliangium ochraceum DSM 14365]